MNVLAFAAHAHGKNPHLRVCATAFALPCIAGRTQAAEDFVATADRTVAARFTPIPPLPTTTALSLSPKPVRMNQPVIAPATASSIAPTPVGGADKSKTTVTTAAIPAGTVAIAGGSQNCNATVVNGSGNCALVHAVPDSIAFALPGLSVLTS